MPSPAPRLVLRVQEWPDIDQELWRAGLAPRDQFDGPQYAAGLSPMMIRNAARGHGRWLSVLAAKGTLDPTTPPAARVTPSHVRAYLAALRDAGNVNNAIVTRFFDLQASLRIMQPEIDFSWLTSPQGTSLRSLLPATLRPLQPIDGAVLLAWGHDLMDDALRRAHPMVRCTRFRNGLLIAILAALAPRLRSVSSIELGRQVIDHGNGYQLVFAAQDVKNKHRIEYPIPPELVPRMERWLAVERPELLAGRQHNWLWVNTAGEKLDAQGIQSVIRRASQARFGKTFGTHSFRHALATTAAKADPSNPGLAAAILAVSEAVVSKHYNLARQEDAAEAYLAHVEEERRQTRLLAAQHFRGLGYE